MSTGKICTKCGVELRCFKNGVIALAMGIDGPQEMWSADLFHCPVCRMEAIIGLSAKPIAYSFSPDFQQKLDIYRSHPDTPVYEYWSNQRERDQSTSKPPDQVILDRINGVEMLAQANNFARIARAITMEKNPDEVRRLCASLGKEMAILGNYLVETASL